MNSISHLKLNILSQILLSCGLGFLFIVSLTLLFPTPARAANQTISGIVYTNDETTAYGTVTAVNLSVNGAAFQTVNSTITTGAWSFTVADPVAGDIITIWLDTGGAGSIQASLVLQYGASCTGTPNCTGLKLVRDQVRIDNKHTDAVTNTDLSVCDNDSGTGCTDADLGYTSNSGTLTTTWATTEVKVAAGTFAPGGNVTTTALDIAGTYTGSTETITLSGTGTSTTCTATTALPLCITGIFTPTSNTVTYTGNGATVGSYGYANLELKPASSSAQILSTNQYNYSGLNFDVTASGNGSPIGMTFHDGFFWVVDITDDEVYKYNADGSYTGTSFDTNASGNTDPYGIEYYGGYLWVTDNAGDEVYKYNLDGSYTGTSFDTNASGNTGPYAIAYYNGFFWIADNPGARVYKYQTDGTYTATSFDISGSGNANPTGLIFKDNYLLISDNSDDEVYIYNAADLSYASRSFDTAVWGSTNPTDFAYYNGHFWLMENLSDIAFAFTAGLSVSNNLTIGDSTNAGATGTANDPTIIVGGNVSIAAGATFAAPDIASNTIYVGGNWANSGTFTHSSNTVEFTATDTANTINAGSSSFYNVIFNGSGGSWTPVTNTMTLAGDLTLTAGTLDESGGAPSDLTVVTAHIQCGVTCGAFNFTTAGTVTHQQQVVSGSPKNFGTSVSGDSTDWTFYNLTFKTNNIGGIPEISSVGSGIVKINGTLTVSPISTPVSNFSLGNRTWEFTGQNPITVDQSGFFPGTSTVKFTGNGASLPAMAFYNVEVLPAGSTNMVLQVPSGHYAGNTFSVADNIAASNVRGIEYYDNHFWVVDGVSAAEVYKYTTAGVYTGIHFDTAASGNTVPRGILYYDNHFWITDGTGAEVYKYQTDGTYTGEHFDTAGSGATQPIDIEYANGFFYIANFSTPRSIFKYNIDGTYTTETFTTTTCGDISLAGIEYHDDYFWVLFNSPATHKICKFSLDGIFQDFSFFASGSSNARGFALYNEYLWTTDANDRAVHQYSTSPIGLRAVNNLTIGDGTNAGLDNSVNNTRITIGANLTVNPNATFTPGTTTVTFDGSGTSTVNGNSTNFYNLSSSTPGKTLNFQAGETIGVTNSLNFTGVSDSNIAIQSTSASEQWILNLTGTGTADYVSVTNSGCTGGNSVSATNFTNGGNNGACWPYGSGTASSGGSSGGGPSTGSTGSPQAGSGGGVPSVPTQPNNPQAPSTSPVSSLCYYLPGSLVRDGITIYFISKPGTAVGFTNYEAFVGLGYDKIPFTQASVANCYLSTSYYLSSPDQAHAWGTWLLYNGTVYYSHETGLIPVSSLEIFYANGGNLDYALTANLEDLNQLKSTIPLMEANDQRVGR